MTSFHVEVAATSLPDAVRVTVEAVQRAVSEPPPQAALRGTRTRAIVVITVRSAKHLPVSVPD